MKPVTARGVEMIKDMIRSGELVRGQQLPREQDLARQLNLSRGSLRSAVQTLAAIGVLDVRVGDGTYVTELDPARLFSPLSFLTEISDDEEVLLLLDLRMTVEPVATGRAAGRLTDDDVVKINDSLDVMRTTTSAEESIRADVAFHRTILSRSGNPLLVSLMDQLSTKTLRSRIWRARAEQGAIGQTHEEHRAIFDAVHRGDRELAIAAATVHIAGVQKWLRANPNSGQLGAEQLVNQLEESHE